jgi:hypothetical protein
MSRNHEISCGRPRHWYSARVGILLIALSLLAGTGVAAGTVRKATLKISGVPASVQKGGGFNVTASGYSGKYNDLEFYPLVAAACKSTSAAQSAQQHSSYGVPTKHNFHTVAQIRLYRYHYGETPGTYHFCVYLRNAANPTGTQLHQSVTYQVTS